MARRAGMMVPERCGKMVEQRHDDDDGDEKAGRAWMEADETGKTGKR